MPDLDLIRAWLAAHPYGGVALAVPASLAVAGLLDLLVRVVAPLVVTRTRSTLDDKLLPLLRRPLAVSVLVIGVGLALARAPMADRALEALRASLASLAVLYWAISAVRIAGVMLDHFAADDVTNIDHHRGLLQRRTVPALRIIANSVIVSAGAYFLLLAWGINVSGWLASAGIVGIAVGFAAQDTLANLVAGMSILADAPYELGDFVALDTGEEGVVTRITFRSTRIRTLQDIEVVVPNSVMAGSRLRNLTGGSAVPSRLDIPVGVAYGSDLALVERLLLDVGRSLDHVLQDSAPPDVRFVAFGASSLDHILRVWLPDPGKKIDVVHQANHAIDAAFRAHDIEIPFTKHDVYLHRVEP